jgi:hypothetical protein
VASRSPELMRLVDRVAAPTHIEPPAGWQVHEFDSAETAEPVTGVVLSLKRRRMWRSISGKTLRQAMEVLVVMLQLSQKKLLRVYVPPELRIQVGDVLRLQLREETLDGRVVLYAESGSVLLPPKESA